MPIDRDDIEPELSAAEDAFRLAGQEPEQGLDVSDAGLVQLRKACRSLSGADRLLADGYYTLQGRRSDLIISGGFNIYPREIEEFLAEQPGVTEVAVASSPDPRRGEVPVAYIAGTCDPAALEEACRANLASFKIPRAFVPIDKLPRTALGKIQKHLLPKWEPKA